MFRGFPLEDALFTHAMKLEAALQEMLVYRVDVGGHGQCLRLEACARIKKSRMERQTKNEDEDASATELMDRAR